MFIGQRFLAFHTVQDRSPEWKLARFFQGEGSDHDEANLIFI
jgi:hypothetical protein